MSIKVEVVGAPGYEDRFPATLRALLPRVDFEAAAPEMLAVLESANGDWHVIPQRFVHNVGPFDVPWYQS